MLVMVCETESPRLNRISTRPSGSRPRPQASQPAPGHLSQPARMRGLFGGIVGVVKLVTLFDQLHQDTKASVDWEDSWQTKYLLVASATPYKACIRLVYVHLLLPLLLSASTSSSASGVALSLCPWSPTSSSSPRPLPPPHILVSTCARCV